MTKTSIAKLINTTMMMLMTLNMTMMTMLRPAVESVEVLTIFYESPRYVHCVRPTPTLLDVTDNEDDDNLNEDLSRKLSHSYRSSSGSKHCE